MQIGQGFLYYVIYSYENAYIMWISDPKIRDYEPKMWGF